MKIQEGDYYIEMYGKKTKVIEVWESFSGWYWFITEKWKDGQAYGLVKGLETEWGNIYMPELESLSPYKVWKVDKKNWIGLPDIVQRFHK